MQQQRAPNAPDTALVESIDSGAVPPADPVPGRSFRALWFGPIVQLLLLLVWLVGLIYLTILMIAASHTDVLDPVAGPALLAAFFAYVAGSSLRTVYPALPRRLAFTDEDIRQVNAFSSQTVRFDQVIRVEWGTGRDRSPHVTLVTTETQLPVRFIGLVRTMADQVAIAQFLYQTFHGIPQTGWDDFRRAVLPNQYLTPEEREERQAQARERFAQAERQFLRPWCWIRMLLLFSVWGIALAGLFLFLRLPTDAAALEQMTDEERTFYQESFNRLSVGMSEAEVLAILGEPTVRDDGDWRWYLPSHRSWRDSNVITARFNKHGTLWGAYWKRRTGLAVGFFVKITR